MVDSARLFRRAMDAEMRDLGITGLQWRIIARLLREPGQRQVQLAEYLEVEPITLSRMLDRLVESDLVERRADPSDRRARLIYLTSRADPLIAKLKNRAETVVEQSMSGLSDSDRNNLADLLEQVRCNLSRKELADA